MRVLVVHNRYQLRGGEDTVVDAEVAALRERGHEVLLHEATNVEPGADERGRLATAAAAIWSRAAAHELEQLTRRFRPHVAHVHNHSYALSPSIYPALQRGGAPVVATLHNYRATCVNAMLLRNDRPCEKCVGKSISRSGITHRCFRSSISGSALVAASQASYRRVMPSIDRWIALTEFARGVFERARFPPERLVVRPNTVPDRGTGPDQRDATLLFAGRLDESKGLRTLLEAWSHAELPADARLTIAGDGPLAAEVAAFAADRPDVQALGRVEPGAMHELMTHAGAVVVPSHWYEGFPMTALEAFAAGTPVIASDLGSLPEIVAPDCGALVPPRDPAALAAAIARLLADRDAAVACGRAARERYEQLYAQDVVMAQLEEIYAAVSRP